MGAIRNNSSLRKLQLLIEEEQFKKSLLRTQKAMGKKLARLIETYWQTMSEKEKKDIIKLGSFTKQLEKDTQRAFKKEVN